MSIPSEDVARGQSAATKASPRELARVESRLEEYWDLARRLRGKPILDHARFRAIIRENLRQLSKLEARLSAADAKKLRKPLRRARQTMEELLERASRT